jgi:hypothetical protein
MINLNDRYFNLIANECFVITEGPILKQNRKEPYYNVLWDDGTISDWFESEMNEWIDDVDLNIKIKDDKHLLVVKIKYSNSMSF